MNKSEIEVKVPTKTRRFPATTQEYPVGLNVCMLVIPETIMILLQV